MLKYEQKYWDDAKQFLAGIDEAGRGPLAGPVVSAAVILPQDIELPGVKDSKKISEKKREVLYGNIQEKALSVGIGWSDVAEIDEKNILKATYQSMRQAVGNLHINPEILLVDGRKADIKHFQQESIINGDQKSLSIAAASIIAKVTRDRMMRQFDIVFPEYGFAKHKGYGTKQHIEAIQKSKATPIHRKSFNPVSHHLPNMAYLQRNRLLGKLGEQLAACQLIRNHQHILEMNYNVPKIGEIDIISKDAEILVFTEVKTQTTGHGWGAPRSQIEEKKRDRIMNAVQHYMDTNELDCDFRFDVAEVILGSGKPQIQIIKDGITGY
jgi:ribonuclease HII